MPYSDIDIFRIYLLMFRYSHNDIEIDIQIRYSHIQIRYSHVHIHTCLQQLLAPTSSILTEISKCRDNQSPVSHQLNMVSEGLGALGWVSVTATPDLNPRAYIESYAGGADFWGNKIRTSCKTSAPDQVEVVKAFQNVLKNLMTFVSTYHKQGLVWNTSPGKLVGAFLV